MKPRGYGMTTSNASSFLFEKISMIIGAGGNVRDNTENAALVEELKTELASLAFCYEFLIPL